ncbi:restriction endonuclease subunit S [Aerococcaceae bacterium DSM 111021]|nr:restriction endonuclease subunit S [Aerococcaceae bacterium DSM 111021]
MAKEERRQPELRFKGFTADWEQGKLGDLGKVSMNKRIFKDQTFESGDVPFYKIGTFGGVPDAYISRELFEDYKSKYPYPTKGDILISASGSIGRTVVYQGGDEYFQDSNIVWLNHEGRIDNKFLNQFYSIVKWEGLEGSTIKRLYNKNILETSIKLPTLTEQKKIGGFFDKFDKIIDLHQRKLDRLKDLKEAYLQQIFPEKNHSVPKLRFNNFSEVWENHKLGEVFEQTTNYVNPKTEKIELWSLTVEKGLTPKTARYNRDFLVKKNDKFKTVNNNEFTYNPMNMTLGAVDLNTLGKTVAVSGYYITMKTTIYFDSKYFNFWLKSPIAIKKYKIYATGSLIERQRIQFPALSKIKVKVPSINEQKKIGLFLMKLEIAITNCQKKLDLLKYLRRACSQLLFP